MARRFGRNQKSAMREKIQILEQGSRDKDNWLNHFRNKSHDLEDVIQRIARVVGDRSVLLPPKNLVLSCNSQPTIDVHRFPDLSYRSLTTLDDFDRKAYIDQIFVLLAKIDKDQLTKAIHTRVKFGDDQIGYAISQEAIQTLPKRELIQRMSEEIAILLSIKLKSL